jgi:hypothetical protein
VPPAAAVGGKLSASGKLDEAVQVRTRIEGQS